MIKAPRSDGSVYALENVMTCARREKTGRKAYTQRSFSPSQPRALFLWPVFSILQGHIGLFVGLIEGPE
jgi:hypothetical protein